MTKTNFQLKESVVADFQLALERAGMQKATDTDGAKPRYYRGNVTDTNQNIYLQFLVTDNLESIAADDECWARDVYINGWLYCRNGAGDAEYQELANNIEIECKKLGISIVFTTDQSATPLDIDSPVYYCDFEATKNNKLKGV